MTGARVATSHAICYTPLAFLGQARLPSKTNLKGHPGFVGDFPIYFRENPQVASTLGASELAGRYAAALFDLADEGKQLDDVAGDFRQLEEMFAGNADLRRLASSPVIRRDEQMKAMTALLTKIGVASLTMQFIGVLSRNRRLFALPQVITAYLSELSRRRGEVAAEVTSARALSGLQQSAIIKALKSVLGGNVAIQQKVEPGLIGGLVVKVGSRMVDSSLRTQLQKLGLAMKGAG
jgi:F-type H+-transporting ATPase subunit delta